MAHTSLGRLSPGATTFNQDRFLDIPYVVDRFLDIPYIVDLMQLQHRWQAVIANNLGHENDGQQQNWRSCLQSDGKVQWDGKTLVSRTTCPFQVMQLHTNGALTTFCLTNHVNIQQLCPGLRWWRGFQPKGWGPPAFLYFFYLHGQRDAHAKSLLKDGFQFLLRRRAKQCKPACLGFSLYELS